MLVDWFYKIGPIQPVDLVHIINQTADSIIDKDIGSIVQFCKSNEHYRGYYELLRMVREKYPEVYLENCSSGGLRIDLGLARHTHGAFLSDPDFTRHHLQLFWGATMILHPSTCSRFSWSHTIVHYASNVDKDPIKPDMPRHRLDYIIRANMLNIFGLSYRCGSASKSSFPRAFRWLKLQIVIQR